MRPSAQSCSRSTSATLLTGLVLALVQPCAAVPAEQRLEFDIAAGPLGAVLLEIAQTGGTVVSFSPSLVERRQAPAVRGSHTLLDALRLAAEPSGLVVERTSAGALTLVEVPPPAGVRPLRDVASPSAAVLPQEAAAVLPRVVVLGSSAQPDAGLMAVRGSSATRTSTLLADLPQSVSILTGEALDLQGSPTSTDALRYVTGVASRIDLSGGQGIVPSLLIRGLPALYAMSGMGTIREALPMDNAFIDRIEVPKGPSTLISGVSSFGGRGGVVNLVRKEAGGDPHRNYMLNVDTKDSGAVRAEADLAGHTGQGPAWRLVAYGSATGRTDGGYDGAGGAGVLGSLSYRHQDVSTTLSLHADQRRITPAPTSRGGLLGPGGRISPLEDGQVDPLDPRDRLLVASADAELGVEWQMQPRWRLSLKTRIEVVDDNLRQRIPQGPRLERRISWWSAALQGGLIGDVETGPLKHKLLLGVDLVNWRMRLVDAPGSVGVDAQLGRFDTSDLKRELLLQDQVRYGNLRVRLSAQAARVPVYMSTPGTVSVGEGRRAVNWDLGVLYRLSGRAAVYAGSQYAIESDIIRAVGSAIFEGDGEPTRTQQIQGGLKVDLMDDRLALTLEAYRTEQTHVLSSPLFGSPGNSGKFFITPRRVVDGLEIDLAGRPWPALDVQLGLGFMRANDVLSTLPGTVPPEVYVPAGAIPARSMHLLSRYTLPQHWLPNTRLGVAARARSSSFAIPPSPVLPGAQLVLPGGAVLDLSVERMFGPWTLNAFVHNVFDRQLYETQSSPGNIPLEPRRSFGLTATYKSPGLRP